LGEGCFDCGCSGTVSIGFLLRVAFLPILFYLLLGIIRYNVVFFCVTSLLFPSIRGMDMETFGISSVLHQVLHQPSGFYISRDFSGLFLG
jgi:hypothetical protein